MKLLLYGQLIMACCSLYTCLPAPTNNHQVLFEGLRHGYDNQTQAAIDLKKGLQSITGFKDITIVSLDEQGARWHVDELNKLDGCPYAQINKLLNSIRPQGDGYTREYKMQMDENFSRPKDFIIEPLGPCSESQYQKRDQIFGRPQSTESGTSTTPESVTSIDDNLELDPKTTTEPPATTLNPITEKSTTNLEMSNSISTDPEESATETPITTTVAPTTTTTTAATTPTTTDMSNSISKSAITTTTTPSSVVTTSKSFNALESSTATDPFKSMFNSSFPSSFSDFSFDKENSSFSSMFESSSRAPENVTEKAAENEKEDAPEKASETVPETTPRPSVETTTSKQETISSDLTSSTTLAYEPEKAPEPAGKTLPEPAPEPADLIDSGKPHYGKYIGLGGGFIIVLAYLVCSRAYKRQGMYELQHNDVPNNE